VALTGLLEVYRGGALPRIALLRGGTMNTVARAVGARRGRSDALLEGLARALRERGPDALPQVERHVLRVRPLEPSACGAEACDTAGARVGFLFGAGVVCGFLAEYYAAGATGPADAARTLLRSVARSVVGSAPEGPLGERFRGRVELASGLGWPPREYLAVAGGTIDQIGLGFRPFPRCDEAPGCFQLLGIHASPLRLVGALPRIYRGAPLGAECAEEAVTPRAVLHPASGSLRYMIDGDLLAGRGPLEVAIGPRVRIVVG
jgi:hypothetical protein